MPREAFERELHAIQDDLLLLGSMAQQALADSVEVLRTRDEEGAKRVIRGDQVINEKRFAIEADCLALIATQQPMAGDLRTLAAVLEIVTELERIGDYGKGIARISLLMGSGPLLKPLVDIPRMQQKAVDMLRRALDAFIRRDVALARAIPQEDAEVDALYNQIYRELLTFMMADPRTIDRATPLLWVAHNLERAADRVTNICERVVFTVTGEMNELDVKEPPE
jgi:phosphate transport system protein